MMKFFRISSNAIYPYRYKGEVRFLRLSPTVEKSFTDVVSEIKLISWLIDNGFPAMKPVLMKNGKFADVVNTEWGTYNVSSFSRVLGKDLEATKGTVDIIKGYGRILGKFHTCKGISFC